MSDWAIDKARVRCGLLSVPVHRVRDSLADLIRLLQKYASDDSRFRVSRLDTRDFEVDLLFHKFFLDRRLTYDSACLLFKRVASGADRSWEQWIERDFRKPAFISRELFAYWRPSNRWRISLYVGFSRFPSLEERQLPCEPDMFGTAVYFNTCSWVVPDETELQTLRKQSREIYLRLSELLQLEPDHAASIGYLGAPSRIFVKNLNLADATARFKSCFTLLEEVFGPAVSVEFSLSNMDTALELQDSSDASSTVWSQIKVTARSKKGFDVFNPPADLTSVRAYPLLWAETETWPDFHFQMTLVHAGGESFIECLAFAPIWFDWISNYFQAPIEVWEGPIENRFGWYGDASSGKLVRHPTDLARVLGAKPTSTARVAKAYLVFPIGVDFDGNTFELNENRYANPHAIFHTQAEAEAYAQVHRANLMDGCELHDLTSRNPDCDLSTLPSFEEICKLAAIEDSSQWREEFEQLVFAPLPDEVMNRIIDLIGIKTFRIIPLELDDKEYKRIEKAIASDNFPEKASAWLAKRAGLDELEGWD